ncbi:hypothetical protein GALMADRAFT_1231551 [Galerina marginata CBS 339.88]|uniref:BTB domain-containing protein n=1 Tax=Galerina marginata (strain CBS 339.88) TaxID=685588 RepID=A0A067T812_GALM3|nr:hypothetical protein GALMADRAFT_1231551 [Galerina marginata CBS 339.88]
MMGDEVPKNTHEKFNPSDADIVIQSVDGLLFRIHRKNLETNTGAFPGPEFDSQGEIVFLSEPAEVLGVVFQFIYPRKHPTLKDLDFKLVAEVAEAVEKYEVFSAMRVCELRLRDFLPQKAIDIFVYAVKHDYSELIDETALLIARSPSLPVLRKLPSHCFIPWVLDYKFIFQHLAKSTS